MPPVHKEISLGGKTVEYTFRKSRRARRVRLTVRLDGTVLLTSPARVPDTIAERFLFEKACWLLAKLDFFSEARKKFDEQGSVPDGAHGARIPRITRHDYLKNKNAALEFVTRKAEYFAALYGCTYKNISVKNQRTVWGSCSRKKNLNFNYKIMALPERTQDYIIVHEICHLHEFNHSPHFWALVARTIPEHKEIRRALRRNGMNVLG